MKAKQASPVTRVTLTALGTLLASSTAFAIEPPADDAPPPPPLAIPQVGLAEPPAEPGIPAEAPPFLGISTSAVPEMLATHLKLDGQEGVLVRAIVDGSPAAIAGISEFDVILQIGDQVVTTPEQLSESILGHAEGDVVKVTRIHQGQQGIVEATLAKRPAGILAQQPVEPLMGIPLLEQMPEGQADLLRDAIRHGMNRNEQALGQLRRQLEQMGDENEIGGLLENLQLQIEGNGLEGFNGPDGAAGVAGHVRGIVRMMDQDGSSIEMETIDGGRTATLRDRHGEITWTGPWDTPQDKDAAPADVRERIEKFGFVDGAPGMRFQLRKGMNLQVQPPIPVPEDIAPAEEDALGKPKKAAEDAPQ